MCVCVCVCVCVCIYIYIYIYIYRRKRSDERSTEALDNIFFKLQRVQASTATSPHITGLICPCSRSLLTLAEGAGVHRDRLRLERSS